MRMDGRMDDGWKTLWYVFYYCINCLNLAIYLFKYVSVKNYVSQQTPCKIVFAPPYILKRRRRRKIRRKTPCRQSGFPVFVWAALSIHKFMLHAWSASVIRRMHCTGHQSISGLTQRDSLSLVCPHLKPI